MQVLSPLGVPPGRQRQGIGSALVRHGLTIVADRAVPLVFLEGSPDYYPRFGFVPGGTLPEDQLLSQDRWRQNTWPSRSTSPSGHG